MKKRRINRREKQLKAEREKWEAERKAMVERLNLEIIQNKKNLATIEIMQDYIKNMKPSPKKEILYHGRVDYSEWLLRQWKKESELIQCILVTVFIGFLMLTGFAIYKNWCN